MKMLASNLMIYLKWRQRKHIDFTPFRFKQSFPNEDNSVNVNINSQLENSSFELRPRSKSR